MAQQHIEPAGAREDLCRFLAACYYEPDPMLAQDGVFESMLTAAERLSDELADGARRLGQAFGAQDVQDLLVDYTRLFLGPPTPLVGPYGSLWLGDDSTPALEGLYREAGFEVDEELSEPADHIALELEFLYLLTFKCNEAGRSGSEVAGAGWALLREMFLREHLGAWVTPFAAAVKANAATAFYRELADLTARFVHAQRARLPGR